MKFNLLHLFPILFTLTLFPAWDAIGSEPDFQPQATAFSVTPLRVAPGDFVHVYLKWVNSGSQPASAEQMVFIHFEKEKSCASIRWQKDDQPSLPATYWTRNLEVEDGPFPLLVPEGTPEGDYFVHAGLWDPVSGQRTLDFYLPDPITVTKAAPSLSPVVVPALPPEEAEQRFTALLKRFEKGPWVQLENEKIQFQLEVETGCFFIKNKTLKTTWQSTPNAAGLGFVLAEQGEKRLRLPLSSFQVIRTRSDECRLAVNAEGRPVLNLVIRLVRSAPALKFSWSPAKEWNIRNVEWNPLLWTTDSQGGGAVIPRLSGLFFPANSGTAFKKIYRTYGGWGGIQIPLAGLLRKTDGALISWDDPSTSLAARSVLGLDDAWPGNQTVSVGLQSSSPSGEFRLDCLEGNSYFDLVRVYRKRADDKGALYHLRDKLRRNPELGKLLGAPEFKPFVCVRRRITSATGTISEEVRNSYTEQDCLAIVRHLHDDLKLSKALFVLAGWIHRGYDNQHPDILPAAPEIGGDEGVRNISELVRSSGYLFGLHDNYQDMYEDAPFWDPNKLIVGRDGKPMKGGVWAGGQAWLIASNFGLQLAQRNLPEVRKRYKPNAYFIDTTYATPLHESFDPQNPMTLQDDLENKSKLGRLAASLFGIHGSETGTEFGVPVSHYFEGILSGRRIVKHFPEPGSLDIPLFPMIFHDCVVLFTHQGEQAGIGDARMILQNLVMGSMPIYKLASHRYWEQALPEPDFSNPAFCFAQGCGGWGEGKHPQDRFIKNTYEFLSPFVERVSLLPMTAHDYLKEDRSVEHSTFGDNWSVVVNYGPEDYMFEKTMLPPMGFIAIGPEFLAQHYYPDYEKKQTCLVVKKGDDVFYGFR